MAFPMELIEQEEALVASNSSIGVHTVPTPVSCPSKADRVCTTTLVQTEAELDALEHDWNQLVCQSDVSVFQTFEWLRTWWKFFNKGRQLHCLVFRSQNRVVGIAPIFQEELRVLGLRIATHLQFMGCPLSDYTDIIILPGHEQAVLNALAKHLRSTCGEWDVFDMENVSEKSNAWKLLTCSLETYGIPMSNHTGTVCQQIVLPPTYELFFQGLGPHVRDNLKRKYKKLQKEQKVEYEAFENETDDISAAVGAFACIHGDRWQSLGYPSAFDDRGLLQFHAEVAKKFARRGWLRLSFLKVDNQRVAVDFSFIYKNRLYMYQCNAFGPEKVMKCSPGSLVKVLSIQRAIGEGVRFLDLMRGDESYKTWEWKATSSKNWLVRGISPFRCGRFRAFLYLSYELFFKTRKRIQREYYEFRRFKIRNKNTSASTVRYAISRIATLFQLGRNYFVGQLRFRDRETLPNVRGEKGVSTGAPSRNPHQVRV
jgi:CelD/BcsL family acetyltransferase involved in cellulose biosynthesis